MIERLVRDDYVIRGAEYEIWRDAHGWYVACPRRNQVLCTDTDFDPPLTNAELMAIDDLVHGR